MEKKINESANKTVGTIFVPVSWRDTKSVFKVTQHLNTNTNNVKHYLNHWYNYILFFKCPKKNIVVNGNNIPEAKNSQHHSMTLWWPKHEIKCSEDICSTKSVDWLILICTIIQRPRDISEYHFVTIPLHCHAMAKCFFLNHTQLFLEVSIHFYHSFSLPEYHKTLRKWNKHLLTQGPLYLLNTRQLQVDVTHWKWHSLKNGTKLVFWP